MTRRFHCQRFRWGFYLLWIVFLLASCSPDTTTEVSSGGNDSWSGDAVASIGRTLVSAAELDRFVLEHHSLVARADGETFQEWLERVVIIRSLIASHYLDWSESMPGVRQRIAQNMLLELGGVPQESEIEEQLARSGENKIEERRSFYSVMVAQDDDGSCGRADALRANTLAGASIESTAKNHSLLSNAAEGGLVPNAARSSLSDSIASIVFTLDVGEVSRVVKSSTGCLFFRLGSIQPAYSHGDERLRHAIFGKMSREGQKAVLDSIKEDLDSAENADVVDALVARYKEEHPSDYAETVNRVGARIAIQKFFEERMMDALRATEESVLRNHHSRYPHRFTSAAQVEFTVASWPLEADQAIAQVNAARSWIDGGGIDDAGQETTKLGLMTVDQLLRRMPQLAPAIKANPDVDSWFGPYRFGDTIYAVHTDYRDDGRSQDYLEALPAVMRDYMLTNIEHLKMEMTAEVKDELGVRVRPLSESRFHAMVADSILQKD